jgi:hypothetical protein
MVLDSLEIEIDDLDHEFELVEIVIPFSYVVVVASGCEYISELEDMGERSFRE